MIVGVRPSDTCPGSNHIDVNAVLIEANEVADSGHESAAECRPQRRKRPSEGSPSVVIVVFRPQEARERGPRHRRPIQ